MAFWEQSYAFGKHYCEAGDFGDSCHCLASASRGRAADLISIGSSCPPASMTRIDLRATHRAPVRDLGALEVGARKAIEPDRTFSSIVSNIVSPHTSTTSPGEKPVGSPGYPRGLQITRVANIS